jgi:hypothetical protein
VTAAELNGGRLEASGSQLEGEIGFFLLREFSGEQALDTTDSLALHGDGSLVYDAVFMFGALNNFHFHRFFGPEGR